MFWPNDVLRREYFVIELQYFLSFKYICISITRAEQIINLFLPNNFLLVHRIKNTLIIDRFNINHETHIMFNSHWFTLLSIHSCFSSLMLRDHNCFSSSCSLSIFSRIHLPHSFFLLPWNSSDAQITPHHNYVHTLATLILPYKHYVYSFHNM